MRYITPETVIARRLAGREPPPWNVAVVCFRDAERSGLFVEHVQAQPIDAKLLWGFIDCPGHEAAHEFKVGKARVGLVTRCIWGGPQAAILVEELAAFGVEYVIGWGCAGSLEADLGKGAQFVVTRAITTDGASQAYTDAPVIGPDPGLAQHVREAAAGLACDVRPVTAATTDAIYRETPEAVAAWRQRGAQIVNMETAAFYAAAEACGIKSVLIGYITDCLAQTWRDWYSDQADAADQSIHLCVELVRRLVA